MKQGKCPKCGSMNIFTAEDLPLKSGPFGSNSIPVTLTTIAALDNYVCADCGLVEHYVADASMLKKIAAKWKAVNALEDDETA
jgi:predicted nucleic-acid-binding Zn-ribbon protein